MDQPISINSLPRRPTGKYANYGKSSASPSPQRSHYTPVSSSVVFISHAAQVDRFGIRSAGGYLNKGPAPSRSSETKIVQSPVRYSPPPLPKISPAKCSVEHNKTLLLEALILPRHHLHQVPFVPLVSRCAQKHSEYARVCLCPQLHYF